MTRFIRVVPDGETASVAAHAASFLTPIRGHGTIRIALSGGSTPRALYEVLASDRFRNAIPWTNWEVYWGDERAVPADSPESNYRLAKETLLDSVSIPADQIHRIETERGASAAADAYEALIRERLGDRPRFDLILLGMGDDGHTASLFPGTAAIHEQARLVIAQHVPKLNAERITFTPALINAAERVMFLVSGAAKAEKVREVLEGPYQPDLLPSQIVDPTDGELTWILDASAASRLSPATISTASNKPGTDRV